MSARKDVAAYAATSAAAMEVMSPAIGTSGKTTETLGWRDPPSGLQLAQVHYLIRHGERTPVRTRLLNANPPIPARWNMCHTGQQFQSAVLDMSHETRPIAARNAAKQSLVGSRVDMPVRKAVETTDSDGQRILATQSGECMLGELTDLGRATTNILGSRLRKLYVDKLALLPQQFQAQDADKVYFRSTNMGRTIESLHSAVNGLLGGSYAAATSSFVPTMLVRNGVTENLLPNTFGCSRLRDLDRHFSDWAATIHNPLLSRLDEQLAPQLEGKKPRVDGHPRLNGILDTVRAAKAHGLDIPAVFEDKQVMDAVETAVCDEWYSGYRTEDKAVREQFRRLAMGRFIQELSGRLLAKAKRPSNTPLQMAVYSAHDTSLAGLLSTLDVFDNRWPAFSAAIGVELFSDAKRRSLLQRLGLASDQHYVRMRYGDKELRLPACQAKGDHLPGHEEFCTLEAFARAANALRHPQGMTWEQECDSKLQQT